MPPLRMKAVVFDKYGPPEVLHLKEVPKPIPTEDEILIRIHATTVNSGDARVRGLKVPRGLGIPVRLKLGLLGPRQPVLGFDLAGDVEAAGCNVTTFEPGARVIGSAGFDFGCHAEYRCSPVDGAVASIPEGRSYDEAVAVCFGGVTALYFLERGRLQPGERILVNGASGAVGTIAVQLAKHVGAYVTGVCSARNAELVRSLGADRVIDYESEDFAQARDAYDVVMDTVGNAPFSRVKGTLKPGGRFLMVFGNLVQMIQGRFQEAVVGSGAEDSALFNAQTFRRLMDLLEARALRPVIDRTFALEEIAEAHALVDTGHKRGAVVITVT
jgi:NADPH:quinone reductase-like Zn-dependent oxidoreductase